MSERTPSLHVSDAAAVLRALNAALDLPTTGRARVETMLAELRRLMHRDADVTMLLFDQLERLPCPRVIDRVWVGANFERLEPRSLDQMQQIVDLCEPMWRVTQAKILNDGPAVSLFREDRPDWYEETFLPQHLEPAGWDDICSAAWRLDHGGHMVQLHVLRTPDQPAFTEGDRDLIFLMMQAIAPLIDREMFAVSQLGVGDLSPRQQDVLRLLLRGLSEKEVAREMHRSVETVHNHVRAIYRHFSVNSRGELMARFIDREMIR
ncbi:MAG: LuxR C-terminal-related transcriptional regulator [Planctomycetota bacterium]